MHESACCPQASPAITCVIRTLLGGGAERVMTGMANYWVQHGRAVTIITTSAPETDAYPLDDRVCRMQIQPRIWRPLPFCNIAVSEPQFLALRRAIREAGNDLVLSFMDKMNVQCVLVRLVMTFHLIVMERIHPQYYCYLTRIEKLLQRLFYRLADAVLVQTPQIRDDWAVRLVPRSKIGVLPNPAPPALDLVQPPPLELPDRFVVAVGRLHPNKGYDLLLEGFQRVAALVPDIHLVILGTGEEEAALRKLIAELSLTDRVVMPGEFVDNPQCVMKQAEFLVSTSHIEGIPNVIMEAMACGVPTISFNSPSGGPELLIRHGIDGYLVPHLDLEALTSAMLDLLQNHNRRAGFGLRAAEVTDRFCMNSIMAAWQDVFDQVTSNTMPFDGPSISTHRASGPLADSAGCLPSESTDNQAADDITSVTATSRHT